MFGSYKLKDFYVGNDDGKKEAAYKDDFERYFYDHENIYERILDKQRFLLLGRKGMGKTILAEFIKKTASKNSEWFCEICSFSDFKFQKLKHLKSDDLSPNEFKPVWRWILLLELSKLILKDQSICDEKSVIALEKFIKENFDENNLTAPLILERTETNKFKGEYKFPVGLGGGAERTLERKIAQGTYRQYLNGL